MKLKLVALSSILIGVLLAAPVFANTLNDGIQERYAVGGELLPVSSTPFLFNPIILVAIAIAVLAAGGAILSGKVEIEIVRQ